MGFPKAKQGELAKGAPKTEASRQEERPKLRRVKKRSAQPTKPKQHGWGTVGKKLGVFRGNTRRVGQRGAQNRSERPRGAPNQQNRKNSDRGAVGKKLGVSSGNARRVGEMGAQNRGESARGAPNQQNRKSQRQRCGGKKTWGFQRRKASRPEGRPKPSRVAKRSAQPRNPKGPATEVRWGKNMGFPEGKQGELAKWAPKTEASL